MRTMTHAEWLEEAVVRFGRNPMDWQFVCPRCKTVQSARELREAVGEKWQGYLAFSCIGRFVEGRGCDWTLGGLFQIHELEVVTASGPRPTFVFADPLAADPPALRATAGEEEGPES